MGLSPTDKSEEFVKSGMTLITEVSADKYLNKVKTNIPPKNRLSRPCGGKGGFDDYVERWHQ